MTSFLCVLNGVSTFFAIGSSTNTLLARKQAQDNSETGPSATTEEAWKISGDVMRTLRKIVPDLKTRNDDIQHTGWRSPCNRQCSH